MVGRTTYNRHRDVYIVEMAYAGRNDHDYGKAGGMRAMAKKTTKRKSAFEYETPKGIVVNTKAKPLKYLTNGEINPEWEKEQTQRRPKHND